MRANRCRIFCVQTDYSTNKAIFKPLHKNCMDCEYFKKRVLDKELEKFIKAQKVYNSTKKSDEQINQNKKQSDFAYALGEGKKQCTQL